MPPLADSSDDGVATVDAGRDDIARARPVVVLGRLLRDGERGRATGHQRQHLLGRDAERRPALGGVEVREPAGRARADVDEAAAALEPFDDRRRSPRRADGAAARTATGTPGILVVDQLDDVPGRPEIDVETAGDVTLGDRLTVLHPAECNTGWIEISTEWY